MGSQRDGHDREPEEQQLCPENGLAGQEWKEAGPARTLGAGEGGGEAEKGAEAEVPGKERTAADFPLRLPRAGLILYIYFKL